MIRSFRQSSLRARLMLLVVLAVLPALGLVLYSSRIQQRLEHRAAQEDTLRLARLAASNQDRLVEGARQLLTAFLQVPEIRIGNPGACSALLAHLLRQFPRYANFGVADARGQIFCSGLPIDRPVDASARSWFQRSLTAKGFAAGDYQIGTITHKATINFADALHDDAGRVERVVFVALDLSWVTQLGAQIDLPQGTTLTVVDRNGTILARYPDPEKWTGKSIPEAAVPETSLVQTSALRKGEGFVEARGVDGVDRIYAIVPLGDTGGQVRAGIPTAAAYASVHSGLISDVTALILAAGLALVAVWFGGAVFILQGVNRLVDATRRLASGDLGPRAGQIHGPAEIAQLAAAFDQMADALEQREAERRRSEQQFAFLAETSKLLGSSLDYHATLANVARAAVPQVADWCVVDMVGEDQSLQRLAVAHIDPAKVEMLFELQRRYPNDPTKPGWSNEVFRTNRSVYVSEIPDTALESASQSAERLRIIRAVGNPKSLIITPIIVGSRVAGIITFVSAESGRRYSAEDVAMVEDLARRAAMAVENAMHYREAQVLNLELERRVTDRTAQLETANKELESFSYSVAHDLRAPLRAMDGFSRMVVEDFASGLPQEGQRYLHLIRDNAQQMGRLIDDLLTFSRLGRQAVNRQPVNTAALVRQVMGDLQHEHEGREIAFAVGELPDCSADPALLKQVFANLISNALKFTRRVDEPRIEVTSRVDGDQPVYSVKDNGVGFDMQYAGKLFGVFQRLHRAEEYEGTGVGLAIVQRIVHRHGGRVWAEAEVDKGATFHFTLGGAST